MSREKQLKIALLTEKLQKLTGKKVNLVEAGFFKGLFGGNKPAAAPVAGQPTTTPAAQPAQPASVNPTFANLTPAQVTAGAKYANANVALQKATQVFTPATKVFGDCSFGTPKLAPSNDANDINIVIPVMGSDKIQKAVLMFNAYVNTTAFPAGAARMGKFNNLAAIKAKLPAFTAQDQQVLNNVIKNFYS